MAYTRRAAKEPTKLAVVPGRKSPREVADQFEREVAEELLTRSGREGHENLGPIVKGVLKLAALQFGAAQYMFEEGLDSGDRQLLASASTMSSGARLNLTSAHNLAVGQARALKEEDDEGGSEFWQPKAGRQKPGRPAA